VLSGWGLCDELITRLEESYRLWCIVVCDLETSWMRRSWPTGGCSAKNKKKVRLGMFTWISKTLVLCHSNTGFYSRLKINVFFQTRRLLKWKVYFLLISNPTPDG